MKKCPTCEKTFEDNLRFCQTDGTPLVAAEDETDPYKTVVANQADLPIPPLDPFKTMVGTAIPEEPAKEEAVLDLAELPEQEAIDPLKTIVSSDFPKWQAAAQPDTDDVIPAADIPPPSPFSEQSGEVQPGSDSGNLSSTPPDPPKFSEPDLNPPNFGDISSAPENYPVETPGGFSTPSVEPPPIESPPPFEPSEPAPMMDEPLGGGLLETEPETSTSDQFNDPYANSGNIPIPSPFDASMPASYQAPTTPMPQYSDPGKNPINPFGQAEGGNQALEGFGWNPPPAPVTGWQDQAIGQNTPFNPPPAGSQEPDKTLAIFSIVMAGLGVLLLLPTILLVWCGVLPFLLGVAAIITGFLGRSRANSQPQQYSGGGLALAGVLLGFVSALGPIVIVIFYVVLLSGLGLLGNF